MLIAYMKFSRNRRDLSSVFNDQDNEFVKKLTTFDSVTVNRNHHSVNELANKSMLMIQLDREIFSDLIKHYKIISKFLWEMMFIILLNKMEYKIRIE